MKTIYQYILSCISVVAIFSSAIASNEISISTQEILSSSNQVILFSLDPMVRNKSGKDSFYGYKILGKIILDADDSISAKQAIKEDIKNANNVGSLCFNPRHVIETDYNKHIYDFVICYECHKLIVLRDGKQVENYSIQNGDNTLNNFLNVANVTIAK